MQRLFTQPNVRASGPSKVTLQPGGSAPNFALPRKVVSEGFFANLKHFLTERGLKTVDPHASRFLAQPSRTNPIDNLKDCLRPGPKLTGSYTSLSGIASPGVRVESHPLVLSLLYNIRDVILPSKLPALELTSKPVDVPEIWSKRKKLTGARVVSVVLHAALTVLVIVLAAHQAVSIDPIKPTTILIAPPPPGAAPPPPAAAAAPRPVAHVAKRKSFFVKGKLTSPTAVPKVVATKHVVDDPIVAPDPTLGGSPTAGDPGVLGGVLGGQPGGIPGGIPGGVPGGAPSGPPAPVAKPTTSKFVRVGGDVKPPKAIYAPAPVYPQLAEHAGVLGVVVLEAEIDEKGNVVNVRAVGGPPLLFKAAERAVAQWKFEPSYLNGTPVAVQMTVKVNFHS